MPDPIDEYADQIPIEIAAAIDGLSGRTEKAIFVLLLEEGDLSFTEIQHELGDIEPLHPTTLSNAIKNLRQGGLVRQRVMDLDDSQFSSFYSTSEYGNRFIHSLYDSLGDAKGPGGRRRVIIDASDVDLYQAAKDVGGEINQVIGDV